MDEQQRACLERVGMAMRDAVNEVLSKAAPLVAPFGYHKAGVVVTVRLLHDDGEAMDLIAGNLENSDSSVAMLCAVVHAYKSGGATEEGTIEIPEGGEQ